MREILFRGFHENENGKETIYLDGREIQGEWVEGNLFVPDKSNTPTQICIGTNIVRITYDVIPETVGQFIGLTDKNGKKIFEGDILSERPPMNETSYIGYVAYDDESAVYRFMIKNDTNYNGVLLGSYSLSYTVISNIYDNPELLRSECK